MGADVDLSNVRVLIVDDDSVARNALRCVLQVCGAIVDSVPTVTQALECLNETVHDIIISDIGMPGIDGYELIRRVLSLDAKIPAVAATAFAGPADRVRALQAGYNMHVAKPLEPHEILKVVAALVGRLLEINWAIPDADPAARWHCPSRNSLAHVGGEGCGPR